MSYLSSIFTLISHRFPEITKKHEEPYDYIYRAIFLYSRSNTIPHFQEGTKVTPELTPIYILAHCTFSLKLAYILFW
jgi:hypothetical protein